MGKTAKTAKMVRSGAAADRDSDRLHLTEREVKKLMEATKGSRNEARGRRLIEAMEGRRAEGTGPRACLNPARSCKIMRFGTCPSAE